jgi:polyisoprenoid-binding protein YceI
MNGDSMMNLARTTILGTLTLALVLGAGCSNPADDKPEAVVGEKTEAAPATAGAKYTFTEDSSVGFVGSKVTGSHDGGFKQFSGQVLLVDDDPTRSSVDVTIDLDSVWSDNDKLTEHLKSVDFFGVEHYPHSTFKSSKIERNGDEYTVTGNFQLHGVVRSISFPAKITVEPDKVHVNAEFFIKRFDFKIEYPGRADDLIRDEVVIKLDLVATPEASA